MQQVQQINKTTTNQAINSVPRSKEVNYVKMDVCLNSMFCNELLPKENKLPFFRRFSVAHGKRFPSPSNLLLSCCQ